MSKIAINPRLFGVFVASCLALFSHGQSYSRTFDSLLETYTEPTTLKVNSGGESVVAGIAEGSYYLRKLNASGAEVWRCVHDFTLYPAIPTQVNWTSDGDVVVAGSLTVSGSAGPIFVARVDGANGTLKWSTIRGSGTASTALAVGGTATTTYLLYSNSTGLIAEGISSLGQVTWSATQPGTTLGAATVDSLQRWLVARRSPTAGATVETLAYTESGSSSLVHTQSVLGNVTPMYIGEIAGSVFVGFQATESGIYRFTNGITDWSRPIVGLQTLDKVDHSPAETFVIGRNAGSSRLYVLNRTTGSELRSRMFGSRIYGLGPDAAGGYGYCGNGYAALSATNGSDAWFTPIHTGFAGGHARLGYLTPSGTYLIAAGFLQEDQLWLELDYSLSAGTGEIVGQTRAQIIAGYNAGGPVNPLGDERAQALDTALTGYGLRVLMSEGQIESESAYQGQHYQTGGIDFDRNVVLLETPDFASTFIRRLDRQGNTLLYRYLGEYGSYQITFGPAGTMFVVLRRNGFPAQMKKLNANGDEIWVRNLEANAVSFERADSSGGISYVAEPNTYYIRSNGSVGWSRPGLWLRGPGTDGSYYLLARQVNNGTFTLERRSSADALVWSREVTAVQGSIANEILVDAQGNAVLTLGDQIGWTAASYDQVGNLRWSKNFSGDHPFRHAMIQGKDLAVAGHAQTGSNPRDVTFRRVRNQVGGTDDYIRREEPGRDNLVRIEVDFAGDVYIGGTSDRKDRDSFVWKIGGEGHRFYASSFTVLAGEEFSGSITSLRESDDVRLNLLSDSNGNTSIEIGAVADNSSGTQLRGLVEHNCSRPGMAVAIRWWNFGSSQWVFAAGTAASLTDRQTTIATTGSTYLGPSSEVRLQVDWTSINDEDPSQDGWLCGLDLVALHQTME